MFSWFKRKQPEQKKRAAPSFPARNPLRRGFAAAKTTTLTERWTRTPVPIDHVVHMELRSLRARSREQAQNNDYLRRFVAMCKSHVVGPDGVILQARASSAKGKPDRLANAAIEAAWREWSRPENCDVTGHSSFAEQQRILIAAVAVDGEVFVRKVARGPFGLQLQHIDPERVPVDYNDRFQNGNVIQAGIEYDSYGAPVAYHVQSDTNPEYYGSGRGFVRVPADEIYHLFVREWVGQKRGFPWASTALLRLNMLGGYEDAALVNARVGAAKMGFIETPSGDGYIGDDEDAQGNIIAEAEPGVFEEVPAGTQFHEFNPQYPNGEFGDFVKAALRGIASGLGVSYHKLANDLEGVNYSSGRLGELEDREIWKTIQQWFIDTFLRRVYDDWIKSALIRQKITVAGRPLKVERLEKFRRVSWQPRRWQWVDPQKEVNAQKVAIELGLRSRSDIIREQGRDPEDVWAEIAREREVMAAMGIDPDTGQSEPPPEDDKPEPA